MFEKLDDLAQHVRETVPQSKAITHFEVKEPLQAVTFKWNGMEFLVRMSLEVFQVKEKRIYITAGSMLMQAALLSASRIDRVLAGSVDSLDQAMDLLKKSEVTKAMMLVEPVKKVLQRLVPKAPK